jgi:hypothetical protein
MNRRMPDITPEVTRCREAGPLTYRHGHSMNEHAISLTAKLPARTVLQAPGLAAILVAWPSMAAAQPIGPDAVSRLEVGASPLAEQRHAVGRRLYAAGDLKGALAEFEVAASLHPTSAKIAFNLARVHERLGHFSEAIGFYERYLSLDPRASDAADVRTLVQVLSARQAATIASTTGSLVVLCDVPGEVVVVANDRVARACGAAWDAMSPGVVPVSLNLAPFPPVEATATVLAGTSVTLQLPPTARLSVAADAPNAALRVGEIALGALPVHERPFPVGTHRLVVTDAKGARREVELTLGPGEKQAIDVHLPVLSSPETPTWAVWTIGIGAAMVVAGLSGLAYHETTNGDGLTRETHDVLRVAVPVLSFGGGAALSVGVVGALWRDEP